MDNINLEEVFAELLKMAQENENDRKIIENEINEMLDDLLASDFFWTEGQCDPRWDRRNIY